MVRLKRIEGGLYELECGKRLYNSFLMNVGYGRMRNNTLPTFISTNDISHYRVYYTDGELYLDYNDYRDLVLVVDKIGYFTRKEYEYREKEMLEYVLTKEFERVSKKK